MLRIYKELHYIFEIESKAEDAFKMAEIELGFLYNQLYTKIPMVLSRTGVILRCICLSFTVSTLIAFLIIVGKHGYSKVDIDISYLLMVGAIFLEIYSFCILAPTNNGIRSMAQHSVLDYCINLRKSKLTALLKLFDSEDNLEMYVHTSWKDVNLDLKEIIYSYLLEKRKRYEAAKFSFNDLSGILDEKGYKVFHEKGSLGCYLEDIDWSISEVEFTHSRLLWHIATDLVLYDDH
ncbi:hypothetical protein DITRI_Ditri13aG0162400 [Diplodiscus trichospermus]